MTNVKLKNKEVNYKNNQIDIFNGILTSKLSSLNKENFDNFNEEIFSKFKKDSEGNYYNERLDEEIIRRKKYSESRRENRKKKTTYEEDMLNICNSYEEHMGTETITKTINETENKKTSTCWFFY